MKLEQKEQLAPDDPALLEIKTSLMHKLVALEIAKLDRTPVELTPTPYLVKSPTKIIADDSAEIAPMPLPKKTAA